MTFIALNPKPILCLIFQVNVHDDNPVQISEAIRSLDERYHLVNFSNSNFTIIYDDVTR